MRAEWLRIEQLSGAYSVLGMLWVVMGFLCLLFSLLQVWPIGEGILVAMCFLGMGIAHILMGRYLTRHRHLHFCIIMGWLTCVSLPPLGTLLGILTILDLNRPRIRARFNRR